MKLNLDEASKALDIAICADVNINMFGSTGIGKTSITNLLAYDFSHKVSEGNHPLKDHVAVVKALEENKKLVNIESIKTAYLMSHDFGIPRIIEEKYQDWNGNECVDYINISSRPDWLPRQDTPGLHIFNFDEMNRGPTIAINCLMEITQEGRVRRYRVPPLSRFIASCNPPTGKYMTKPLDDALAARFCHIHVIPEVETFINNRSHLLDPITISYLLETQNDIVTSEDFDVSEVVVPSFRTRETWARIGRFMMEQSDEWIDSNIRILKAMSQGLIGVKESMDWWRTYEDKNWISISEILENPDFFNQLKERGHIYTIIASHFIKKISESHLSVDKNKRKAELDNLSTFVESYKEDAPDVLSGLIRHFLSNLKDPEFSAVSKSILKNKWAILHTKEMKERVLSVRS